MARIIFKKNKKAQVWSLDYLIGLLMFLVSLGVAFLLIRDMGSEKNRFEDVVIESSHISTNLISQGTPTDWNSSNVLILGLCNNNRVNLTKLEEYDKLTYPKTKLLFQTSGEYVFYFEGSEGIINKTKCFRGYNISDNCTLILPNDKYDNLVKSERLVILDSQIVKMVVLSWNKN